MVWPVRFCLFLYCSFMEYQYFYCRKYETDIKMNILVKNAVVLPMTASEASGSYFKGAVGVEGERIAMVSDKG